MRFHLTSTRAWRRACPLRILALLLLLVAAVPVLPAETRRMLLVHTADVHDHIRPGYIGIGGLPYVSGYIRQVRAERDDVLLVDAGDLMEKGDLVAYRTHGDVTAEAFGRIGYDAMVFGNHDFDYGISGLRRFEELLGTDFLMLNLVDPSGKPVFEPSRVVEVNGIRIGLIGMIAPRSLHFGGLDEKQSGLALAAEAERLKQETHLVIAICHAGSRQLREWSAAAPAVDVLVAAHTHETLLEPIVVEETGALIVSAGADAHWVGRLELEVDLEGKKVLDYAGELVLMRHDTIPVDEEMVAWLKDKEAQHTPEASEFVIDLEEPVGWFALGRLAAEAIRLRADAEIGFYHPTQLIRNSLPAGRIDANAVFRVSAERVDPILRLEMTGEEINRYLDGMSMSNWGQTQWAGFSMAVEEKADGKSIYRTDLIPDRLYRVAVAEREWDRYIIEHFDPAYLRSLYGTRFPIPAPGEPLPRRNFPGEPVNFTFLEAFTSYLRKVGDSGQTLQEHLAELRAKQGGADPNEARFESRFLRSVSPEYYLDREAQAAR